MTRVVLLLALLCGGSTDSSSSTSATVFLYRQSFCLCLHFPQYPSNLGLLSCLPLCFPLHLSLPFLPLACLPFLILSPQRRFPLAFLPLALNGLAAMTVSPLSSFPLSVS